MIEIKKDELDCDPSQLDTAAHIVEGIVRWCHDEHKYIQGWRNSVAVDLCSALYLLGYEDDEDWDEFFKEHCCTTPHEIIDFQQRSTTLNYYVSFWYDDGEIFDKMLHKDKWMTLTMGRDLKLFSIV